MSDMPVPSTLTRENAPRLPVRTLDVIASWWLLVFADVLQRFCGFDRFYRVMRRWPTFRAAPVRVRMGRALMICASVNRARTYYVRQAWCLQAAAAAVCLLRLHGIHAALVIGVRKLPFYAHAWVTVDGEVVLNNREGLAELFHEITRC